MKKLKQILAIIAVIAIACLYITTLILAILGKEYENFFKASLFATIVLPIMLYIIFWLRKVLSDYANK